MNDKKQQVFVIHARPLMPIKLEARLVRRQFCATRGATFAIKKGRFGLFYTAMALCGKKDNFNRKIGRTIAMQRLEKKKLWHSRKSLSSVLSDIAAICSRHGYTVPLKSVQYLEDTFNGKGDKRR